MIEIIDYAVGVASGITLGAMIVFAYWLDWELKRQGKKIMHLL